MIVRLRHQGPAAGPHRGVVLRVQLLLTLADREERGTGLAVTRGSGTLKQGNTFWLVMHPRNVERCLAVLYESE